MSSATKPHEITAPYPGLRPFQPHEAKIFFGRDEHVADMLTVLEDHRFLAVVGPSGAGKSSLVLAGLLPALQDGMLLTARSTDWRMIVLRPGDAPFRNLAAAVRKNLVPTEAVSGNWKFHDGDPALTEIVLRVSPFGFMQTVLDANIGDTTNLLLVVDQFEELFRFRNVDMTATTAAEAAQRRNDATAFVQLLLATARQTKRAVHVMLTMRSDYLGECDMFEGLPQAINESQFLTPRLTFHQLEQAIERPLTLPQFAGRVQRELVQRILNDMGSDRDQLPVVQHAMFRTWQRARSHSGSGPLDLQLADYEKIGGIQDALSRHCDEAFDELSKRGLERVVERVFRALCTLGPTGQRIRRPIKIGALAKEAGANLKEIESVVQTFARADRCFVVASPAGPLTEETTVDISHESLIRQWRKLSDPAHVGAGWIEKEEAAARRWRRLVESARMDQERTSIRDSSKPSARLRDPELQRVLDWWEAERPTEAWANRYEPGTFQLVKDFVDESRTERDRERQRAAELRQERENAKLREQELKYAQQRSNLFKKMSMGIATVAVIALIMAGGAVWQWSAAQSARTVAIAEREVARQAEAVAEKQRKAAVDAEAIAEKQRKAAVDAEAVAVTEREAAQQARTVAEEEKEKATKRAEEAEIGRILADRAAEAARNMTSALVNNSVWRPGPREILFAAEMARQSKKAGIRVLSAEQALLDSVPPRELGGHDSTVLKVFANATGGTTISVDLNQNVRQIKFPEQWPTQSTAIRALENVGLPMVQSRDGKFLVMNQANQALQILNLVEGGEPKSIRLAVQKAAAGQNTLKTLAMGNGFVASGFFDGTVQLHDRTTERSFAVGELKQPVSLLAVSPDDHWLAAASDSQFVVWQTKSRQQVRQSPMNQDRVTGIGFTGDSQWLVSGYQSGKVMAMRVEENRLSDEQVMLTDDFVEVSVLAVAGVRPWVAVGKRNGSVLLWNLADGVQPKPTATLLGHDKEIAEIAFGPEDQQLLSVGADRSVRVTDLNAGSQFPMRVLRDPGRANDSIGGTFNSAAFMGERVVTGGSRLLVWELNLDRLLSEGGQTAKRNLTHAEWQQFFPGKEYVATFKGLPTPRGVLNPSDKSIRYFVDRLPDMPEANAIAMVDRAAKSWEHVANVKFRMVNSIDDANVVLKTVTPEVFQGYGDASIGPPADLQLEIRFNSEESWDADKFLATACHNFGHILGLKHTYITSQVMNPMFTHEIKSPQSEDIRLAQEIWGVNTVVVAVAAQGIEGLSADLIQHYDQNRTEAWHAQEAQPDRVYSALRVFSNANLLAPEAASSQDIPAEKKLNLAEQATKQFQRIAKLPEDGVLGKSTLARLDQFLVCQSTRDGNSPAVRLQADSQAAQVNLKLRGSAMFVFIKDLPRAVSPKTAQLLVQAAAETWTKPTQTTIRIVNSIEQANVVITTRASRGATHSLGHADVGGTELLRTNRLEIALDDRSLTREELVHAALVHHFGHILGLEHTSTPEQGMSSLMDTQQPIRRPTDEDLRRAYELWNYRAKR